MTDTGPTMADWLEHNGLTADLCMRILQDHPYQPPVAETVSTNAPTTYSAEHIWRLCGKAASSRLSGLKDASSKVVNEAQVDFEPDHARYPRAFTLHDNGMGRPFVSCPWQGRLSDVLMVAHEFGHALQIVASEGRTMPPVLRETCASLSEIWLVNALERVDTEASNQLTDLHGARAKRNFARDEPVLRGALATSDSPYSYQWNYPLAQNLAVQFEQELEDETIVSVFKNLCSIEELLSKLKN